MHASFRALLAESIDYAGLFPPACLPLDEAIRNYARYLAEPEVWMLARFVCPATRLDELSLLVEEHFARGARFHITALNRGGVSRAEFFNGLGKDLDAINTFAARHAEQAVVDVIETRLPSDVLDNGLQDLFDTTFDRIRNSTPSIRTLFHEGTPSEKWRELMPVVVTTYSSRRAAYESARGRQKLMTGFKLRTGGQDSSAFPMSRQIAQILVACGRSQWKPRLTANRGFVSGGPVLWKATAGLHQPLTHFDAAIGVRAFGFINLFTAAVLTRGHGLNEDQIGAILEDEQPAHFHFDDNGLAWQDLRATTDEIRWARQSTLVSFGSCSFDEPREGLRALGWL